MVFAGFTLDTMALAANAAEKAALDKLRQGAGDEGALNVINSKQVSTLFTHINDMAPNAARDSAGNNLQAAIKKDPDFVSRLEHNLNPDLTNRIIALAQNRPDLLPGVVSSVIANPTKIQDVLNKAAATPGGPPPPAPGTPAADRKDTAPAPPAPGSDHSVAPSPSDTNGDGYNDGDDGGNKSPDDTGPDAMQIMADFASIKPDGTPKYPGFDKLSATINTMPELKDALNGAQTKGGAPDPAHAKMLSDLKNYAGSHPNFFNDMNDMLKKSPQAAHTIATQLREKPEDLIPNFERYKKMEHFRDSLTSKLGGPNSPLGGIVNKLFDMLQNGPFAAILQKLLGPMMDKFSNSPVGSKILGALDHMGDQVTTLKQSLNDPTKSPVTGLSSTPGHDLAAQLALKGQAPGATASLMKPDGTSVTLTNANNTLGLNTPGNAQLQLQQQQLAPPSISPANP